ncbi:MAG: hypothetical protein CVU48_10855 [Candidatus Cloacimonetes bacterium HGW-Cloacimonetes-1]|nr:MAG: hypothetical protein CVU48_10855 [Candidatus Cloacimonetes bacterium HGW-Cloacimonetes-1]
MKLRWIIFIGMALVFLAACNNSNTTGPDDEEINPFTNGGTERNLIVVMSDWHLGADLSYSEINSNLTSLVKLLDLIRVAPNVKELVIAGDMLDEWFIPATINTYQGQDQLAFVRVLPRPTKV